MEPWQGEKPLCLSPAAKMRAEVEYAVKSYLIRILNLVVKARVLEVLQN